nr:MAG TPA: hypothetical protein [Caudoviricetes sp.]
MTANPCGMQSGDKDSHGTVASLCSTGWHWVKMVG